MSEEEFFNRMINQISKVFDGRIATKMKNIYLKKDKQLNKQKEILDKIKKIVDKAPCLWCVDEEFERVDGTIELSYEEYTGWKDILELLEEIE